MTTTHRIEIPPKFWDDHADRCVERTVIVTKGKNGRIAVELTGDEVADLHSDAVHYSDPGDYDRDFFALCMSARATRKAIEAQVPNLDELRAEWRANAEAARQAYLASDEYAAYQAECQARREIIEKAARLNPIPHNAKGVRVRHEQIGNEWHEIRSTAYMMGTHHITTSGGTIMVRGLWNAGLRELGIEVDA